MRTLIIAEAGVNHGGSLEQAKKLIDAAASAGADAVKFQTFRAEKLVTTVAKKANYQTLAMGDNLSQFEMLKQLEISREMHFELIDHCKQKKISFLSTGFDEDSVSFLINLGVKLIKIPSGEITNLPYLRVLGGYGKEILLSTGMSNMGEIESAIEVLDRAGTPRSKITVLHCNSQYPTPVEDVNLKAMLSIQQAFGVKVGYSDHSTGIEIALASVAMGATVVEKHITLDRGLLGPDQAASTEPEEFTRMVSAIRNLEQALGDGIKRPSNSEKENISVARKSIVASQDIECGDMFTVNNLTVKRPGTGISPMRWDEILGRKAGRLFVKDELIEI